MEKIKVSICGREYGFVTDDAPELISMVAGKLEEKINEFSEHRFRSNEEMLTLVALNVMNEAEKDMLAVKNVIGELHKKVTALEEENVALKEHGERTLNESVKSATAEFVQMAQVKEEENELLRNMINEHERSIQRQNEEREIELKRLSDGFDSATKEMAHIAQNKEEENNTLRNALSTYETTFDNYVKLKEEEIVRLRKQLEKTNIERDVLKAKLATGIDIDQLTMDSTSKYYD
jgi:hypothetical protein